ncbi:MAG: FHA domain-containing protein [Ardenticatenaceae bacterium]|nr:FHA domain-containing protein [Ardenticatenaceae bacterium]
MIACPECGTGNLPNTLFCGRCSADLRERRLAWRGHEPQRTVRCHLLDSGQQLVLPPDPVLIFGRADHTVDLRPDVDLNPYGALSAGVSRRHAQLLQRDNTLYLEDLQSLNGTYVNGVRLHPHQPMRLQPDAIVRFGQFQLRFEPAEKPA